MLPVGDIVRKHGVSFHCYADDIPLYISLWPGEKYQFEKLTECIVDIKTGRRVISYCKILKKNRGLLNYSDLKPQHVIT